MANEMLWVGEIARSNYATLLGQLDTLMAPESSWLTNLANAASLVYHTLPDLNWAGFYLRRGDELLLGPFQGKPACIRIPVGKGVCGTAAVQRKTIVVPDVHLFVGHIACDDASNAEIVVPLEVAGHVWGVMDLDSPHKGRFSSVDRLYLEQFVAILHDHINWPAVCSVL